MSKTTAKKRKPIREDPFDEIGDNIQNNAKIITRSKSRQPETYNYLQPEYRDDFSISTDEEEEEEEEEEEGDLLHLSSTDDMNKVSHTFQGLKQRNEAHIQRTPLMDRKNLDNAKKEKEKNSSLSLPLITGLLLFTIFFLLLLQYRSSYTDIDSSGIKIKKSLKEERIDVVTKTLKDIRSRYKNQAQNLWLNAYSSIISIIHQPKTPSIIILLGNTSDPLNCLARLLGDVSSNALNSHKLILTPEKFESDMGSVIESLRSKIKENRVVIITDLLNINVEALKAFHNLCDRINPFIEEVIYIITIIADGYDKRSNPLEFIENELYEKLSGKMKGDAIQPLITRITDGPILLVQPEPTVEDCPLNL